MKGENLKILILEDNQQDREGFVESVEVYHSKTSREVTIEAVKTTEEAILILDNTFDGAVIDMSIETDGDAGNIVIDRIISLNMRIPISILTGTPDNVTIESKNIKIHKKGKAKHSDMLDDFWQTYISGITKVMGGRGTIEELLNLTYHNHILPQSAAWIKHGEANSVRSEKALLRHTLNHLIQMIDLDEDVCLPEEFYIYPAFDEKLRTGCIVKRKSDDRQFVLLTPLCDLTPRSDLGGEYKASNLILASIESIDEIYESQPTSKKGGGKKRSLEVSLKSNKRLDFHALPKTSKIDGGYIVFETIFSIPKSEFTDNFSSPISQIAPSFLKDIVSRFSAYLGRQGQPEIDH